MIDAVTFADNEMTLRFDSFDLDRYGLFLKAKKLPEYRVGYDPDRETYAITAPARFAAMLGVDRPEWSGGDLPFNPCLYDDQRYIVRMALESERFAVWSDCGLGKTLEEFEFLRQAIHRTGGKGLLVSLNEVVPQLLAEAARFYPDLALRRLDSQAEMIRWCGEPGPGAAVVNYEKFNPKGLGGVVVPNVAKLACVVLDESSRLKGGGDSKQKKVINASCKGVRYKLSCTATPAPNETIEFTSQATFLEKVKTDADIIWTYFTRNTTTHRREVRPHARDAFFDFMASWSIYLKNPKRFGWRLDLPEVPPPVLIEHPIPCNEAQRTESLRVLADTLGTGSLFINRETNAIERLKLAQIARGFRYHRDTKTGPRKVRSIPSAKPGYVAKLAASEVQGGHQVLLWTTFDEESALLNRLLADDDGTCDGLALLTGDTKEADRIDILRRFRDGEVRCLVSRPKMLGYGMNFQFCTSMIFSGLSDSFEELYQAIRRAVRHGQSHRVRVHFPYIDELEGETFANVKRKAAQHERDTARMEDAYLASYRKLMGIAS